MSGFNFLFFVKVLLFKALTTTQGFCGGVGPQHHPKNIQEIAAKQNIQLAPMTEIFPKALI